MEATFKGMSTRKSITGFILAGGSSTRMGHDKALLDWHGRSLLEHMIGLVSSVAEPVHVVGRGQLPDRVSGRGPLSGIVTALATSQTEANLVVAVDLPLLTKDFLKYLRSRLEISKQPLLACKIGSHFPLCLGLGRTLLPELEKRLSGGDLSIHEFIKRSDAELISEVDLRLAGFDASIFRNINTEEDYRSARG